MINTMSETPALASVLETVLYYTDEAQAEHFYSEVLGMRLLEKNEDSYLFYKAGTSTFLLFKRETSMPFHGATGAVHTAFVASPGDYERWKDHLKVHGTPVLHEVEWPAGQLDRKPGLRSFYFQDPDGNALEISNEDIWPR